MSSFDYHDYHCLPKLVILGNTGAVKASLLARFADIDTIGVDFKIQCLLIDDKVIKLQILDTAGHERFRALTKSYYSGVHGVVVVYDITDETSSDLIIRWFNDLKQNTDKNE